MFKRGGEGWLCSVVAVCLYMASDVAEAKPPASLERIAASNFALELTDFVTIPTSSAEGRVRD